MKMVSPSKISRDIPSGRPIVFWDSCMLLYIITVSVRDSFAEYDKYNKLLSWIESGAITSVTSSVVWQEFSQHFDELRDDAIADQDSLKKAMLGYANCVSDPLKSSLISDANNLDLVSVLEDIERRVWRSTYVIKETAMLQKLAHFRVLNKLSPSGVKDQYKDALIWVTFLRMASSMPFAQYEVFVTANKEDYCVTKKSTTPQSQIQSDCVTVNAEISFELDTLINYITRELRP